MNTVGFSDSEAIWLNDCDVAEPLERAFWVYALYFYRHLLHHSKLQEALFKR